MLKRLPLLLGAALVAVFSFSDASAAPRDPFKQLDDVWPTPDAQRRASGAPGPGYWQQQADYVIDVELDEMNNRILGSETITSVSYTHLTLPTKA